MSNRYFVIDSTDSNLSTILTYTVESLSTLRKRQDGTKYLVKLPISDTTNHPELSGYVEYTQEEILLFLDDTEWQPLLAFT